MGDFYMDLLCALLGCGWRDLERLREVSAVAGKFGLDIYDIVDEVKTYRPLISFNDVMDAAIQLTLNRIAEEVEDEELADEIRSHEYLVNYMDSWFNIDPLDTEEAVEMSRGEIVKKVIEYFKGEGDEPL